MRALLLFTCLFCGCGFRLAAQDIVVQPAGGYYSAPVSVSISGGDVPMSAGKIFFTVDGSRPTPRSRAWEGIPLTLRQSTVLRVAVYADGELLTETGGSYLIGEPEAELITLSVGIDPWRLFDSTSGWFMEGKDPERPNWLTHREHPAFVQLTETDGAVVHTGTMGFRLFGGTSRAFAQKSFSLSGREQYGNKRIDHPVFGAEGQDDFRFLVARNGGSDWGRSFLRDALLTGLLRDGSWDLERQDSRPARVYLNGRYWGMYHLREKINPRYLEDHSGVDKDSLSLLEHEGGVKHGRAGEYDALKAFVTTAELARPADYARLGELMDIDNFQRLQIAQTYFDNKDAGGNIRYWRPHRPGGRFRWILYDVDQGFGLHRDSGWTINTLEFLTEPNGPAWPNPPWSTLFQRRLLANPDYRRTFVNRTLDYLHTDFSAEAVTEAIDAATAEISTEMPRQFARWRQNPGLWAYHVDQLRRFGKYRPPYLREHLRQFFQAGPDRTVELEASLGGYIVLNHNLQVGTDGLAGSYFRDFPLTLEAVPEPGYHFAGWEGSSATGPQLELALQEDRLYRLRAKFIPVRHSLAEEVIVTEVCPYSEAGGDWLELHNRGKEGIDLGGWYLIDDSGRRFVFPPGRLESGGYLVVCRKEKKFREVYPGVDHLIGGLPFGLDKQNDRIGLYAHDGSYVNVMSYALPSSADSAFTLALALPGLDNRKHRNWVTEAGHGTPGRRNAAHLQTAVISRQSFWLRIGIGLSVLLAVGLVRSLHLRPRL